MTDPYVNLFITPEKYKKFWWAKLVDQTTSVHKFFTMAELQQYAEIATGTIMSKNFPRAALRYAPIFKTDIMQENVVGRPAVYYCSTRIEKESKYVPPVDDRDPECVKRWPDCESGEYNPKCCRFPKSCSVEQMRSADH